MKKVGIIGAAVLPLVLAGAAIAGNDGSCVVRRVSHDHHHGRLVHRVHVQGLGSAIPAYYPWRSPPYWDGNFPGDHDDDDSALPPSANGG
jgi:hypothetical protein